MKYSKTMLKQVLDYKIYANSAWTQSLRKTSDCSAVVDMRMCNNYVPMFSSYFYYNHVHKFEYNIRLHLIYNKREEYNDMKQSIDDGIAG